MPFTDPDTGIVSDWRIVNITDHAARFTTAVGEAFFIQDEQKIKMVTAYTPHEDGEVEYVSEPYDPSVKPLMVFWGTGQTAANQPDYVTHVLTGTATLDKLPLPVQWRGTGRGSASEIIPAPRCWLQPTCLPATYSCWVGRRLFLITRSCMLPPGMWRLWFTADTKETGDTTLGICMAVRGRWNRG